MYYIYLILLNAHTHTHTQQLALSYLDDHIKMLDRNESLFSSINLFFFVFLMLDLNHFVFVQQPN